MGKQKEKLIEEILQIVERECITCTNRAMNLAELKGYVKGYEDCMCNLTDVIAEILTIYMTEKDGVNGTTESK